MAYTAAGLEPPAARKESDSAVKSSWKSAGGGPRKSSFLKVRRSVRGVLARAKEKRSKRIEMRVVCMLSKLIEGVVNLSAEEGTGGSQVDSKL